MPDHLWTVGSVTHYSTADDLGLLIVRLVLGAVFLAHGINHIFGGGKIAGTGRWFQSLGMKPGIVHAWMASLTEIGAGVLLVLGLLTPFGGAGVVGVMAVAWIANHRKNGFFIFRPGEGWEYVMTLCLLGVAIGTLGAGGWSIDGHVHALEDLWGWPGFGISLGAGGGGALLLLATAWRPGKKPAASTTA
jgi:putative oxidoreductase